MRTWVPRHIILLVIFLLDKGDTMIERRILKQLEEEEQKKVKEMMDYNRNLVTPENILRPLEMFHYQEDFIFSDPKSKKDFRIFKTLSSGQVLVHENIDAGLVKIEVWNRNKMVRLPKPHFPSVSLKPEGFDRIIRRIRGQRTG